MTRISALSAATAPGLVTLTSSPLRHVLCVMQFDPILMITSDPRGQSVAVFQDKIRTRYPSFKIEQQHELRFEADDSGAVIQAPTIISQPSFVFEDSKRGWTVTLTHHSIALQSKGEAYAGREDLIARFDGLLGALNEAFAPVEARRLGFRYVNLFEGDIFASLNRYVNPAMLGFGRKVFGEEFGSSFGQTEGQVGESRIIVKTGLLKEGSIGEFFPAPITQPAWLLDIDAWRQLPTDTSIAALREIAIELTNLNCQMFRWSITETFLEEYRRG